jgi:hypothetical protein
MDMNGRNQVRHHVDQVAPRLLDASLAKGLGAGRRVQSFERARSEPFDSILWIAVTSGRPGPYATVTG